MKTTTHGNGNGLNDLYILPETQNEKMAVMLLLKFVGRSESVHASFSNVEGQSWFGKSFLEVPFGEDLRESIRELADCHRYAVTFKGRLNESLGLCYPIKDVIVCAKDKNQAADFVSVTHGHISRVKVEQID